MQFTPEECPSAFDNLKDEDTRRKAIDCANQMLERGHGETRAIAIGLARALDWAARQEIPDDGREDDASQDSTAQHVLYDTAHRTWVICPEEAGEPTHTFLDRDTAIARAHEIAQDGGVRVYVHGLDGAVVERLDPVDP